MMTLPNIDLLQPAWLRPRFIRDGSKIIEEDRAPIEKKYSAEQARDDHGRWTSDGSSFQAPSTYEGVEKLQATSAEEQKIAKDFEANYGSKISKSQFWQLKEYSMTAATHLNFQLRHDAITDSGKEMVKQIDQAIAGNLLKQDTIVYRGIDMNVGTSNQRSLEEFKPGVLITDRAYSSTSLWIDAATKFVGKGEDVVMAIKLPAGTPALPLYAKNISAWPAEKEMLLPRDLPMRITDVHTYPNLGQNSSGRTVIFAEVVK